MTINKLVWGPGGGGGCGECVYGWYTWFRCFVSAGDVLDMSVVRGVGGVCDKCMCLALGRWEVLGMSG